MTALNIDTLSREEQLQLLERLWDKLSRDERNVPLTEGQRRELDRRLDELDSGDVDGIPWHTVLEHIRKNAR
jgi:putative addiction module component (TIGR02574 family)